MISEPIPNPDVGDMENVVSFAEMERTPLFAEMVTSTLFEEKEYSAPLNGGDEFPALVRDRRDSEFSTLQRTPPLVGTREMLSSPPLTAVGTPPLTTIRVAIAKQVKHFATTRGRGRDVKRRNFFFFF